MKQEGSYKTFLKVVLSKNIRKEMGLLNLVRLLLFAERKYKKTLTRVVEKR
jgi:hypothetical protein